VTAENKDITHSKAGPSTIPLSGILRLEGKGSTELRPAETAFFKKISIQKFQVYEYRNTRITLEKLKLQLMS